jgi:hypothetical protein
MEEAHSRWCTGGGLEGSILSTTQLKMCMRDWHCLLRRQAALTHNTTTLGDVGWDFGSCGSSIQCLSNCVTLHSPSSLLCCRVARALRPPCDQTVQQALSLEGHWPWAPCEATQAPGSAKTCNVSVASSLGERKQQKSWQVGSMPLWGNKIHSASRTMCAAAEASAHETVHACSAPDLCDTRTVIPLPSPFHRCVSRRLGPTPL